MKHLVIMAAGTGGHVFPGLAVADEMIRRGWTVSWLGTENGMECSLVRSIPLDTIRFSGMRGKGLRHSLLGLLRLFQSLRGCYRILGARHADVVLGMGGYVCVPGGLMAALRKKPLVLMNADHDLLLSNRMLAPIAERVAFGFPGLDSLITKRSLICGNPVRPEIEAIARPETRFAQRTGPLRLLVMGGSLGAEAINQALPKAISILPPGKRPVIVHQTGRGKDEAVRAAYEAFRIADVEVVPFIEDVAACLADCDLVICRAGAVTVSELCAAGVASVLVPLALRTTSHQVGNAKYLAVNQAAFHLPQDDLRPERLAQILREASRPGLLKLAARARSLAKPHSASDLADELERLAIRPERRK